MQSKNISIINGENRSEKKMNNEELMHYGIPGMKWGHRKAQTTSSTNNKVRSTKAA